MSDPPTHPGPNVRIARVMVDLALDREFDYLVPAHLAGTLHAGSQVKVPFGHRATTGFVVALADVPARPGLREIDSVLSGGALIRSDVMDLARWIADYYCCPLEQVLRTVLPGAVRREKRGFKEQLHVVPTEKASSEPDLAALRKKARKQAAALDVLVAVGKMPASELAAAAKIDTAAIRSLAAKGFVIVENDSITRDPLAGQDFVRTHPLTLSPEQAAALERVKASIDTGTPAVVLLFGVTGSGKTEVYLQGIQHALDQGKGAIMLVPEISLTPQTLERFRGRFGNEIAVLHSHLSEGERHDEWHRIRSGKARIVVGARSALFAPVENLGVILVDEEHEGSYKQEEAPRYHARDVAVMRGKMHKAAVVLGSATPSVESYHNALRGKYELVRLSRRVDDRQMPNLRIIDMRLDSGVSGKPGILSRDLVDAVRLRMDRGEQTMLFLNRRGFSTSMICPTCGHVATCPNCSVSLTFHKHAGELRCHYCGEAQRVPDRCPNAECRDPAFKFSGTGTERVESIIRQCFPHAVIQRMDRDTMTAKDSYRKVLGDFRTGKIDILVGTQMIAKGLHFPNVTLVGVINADTTLHLPDFRASERAFQLLTQVSGRAGRGEIAGEVIVQTSTPTHIAIQSARRLDYEGFFDQELEARRELLYPPFGHLIVVTLRGTDEALVIRTAADLHARLVPLLAAPVVLSEPGPAPLARLKGSHRHQIVVRGPTTRGITSAFRKASAALRLPRGVQLSIDVDALSMA